MTATNEIVSQEEARQFLEGLGEFFNANCSLDEVRRQMQEYERRVKSENTKLQEREYHFSNHFVVPTIHAYLLKFPFAFLPSDACNALLAEGYQNFKTLASGSPASALKYPFAKQFSAVGKIVQSWWNGTEELPRNAYPDFALRHPCPYRVVGETYGTSCSGCGATPRFS